MSNHAETKVSIFKKWWFWLIILATVIIIAFTTIMMKAFSIVKDEIGSLAIDIQNVYEDATIYTSAGENTIIIELRNWNNDYAEELNQIINIVKSKISNGELQQYSKLMTLTYLESNDIEEVLFIKDVYNLPQFTKDEQETKRYIAFEEYEDLLNTFDNTVGGYSDLFNNIY